MRRHIRGFLLLTILVAGCQKFLDKKADKSRFIVSKVSELQGLFDSENTFNQSPASGLVASDEGYYTNENYNSVFYQIVKDAYTWNPMADLTLEWAPCYQKIYKMNVILEEIEKLMSSENEKDLRPIRGAALFVRAMTHSEVARLFAPGASFNGPDNEFGIPLKLRADIESATTRASLKESYNAIIEDLNLSLRLLPDTGLVKTRPGKQAAYGLLAKIYLDLSDYERSGKYADSALSISNVLIDYNDNSLVDLNSTISFKIMNPEVIYHSSSVYGYDMRNYYADSNLILLYDTNDLRKSAFYQKLAGTAYRFKGSYSGTSITVSFTGLSTNEVFLIRSESKARNGNISGAMQDLNSLLVKRWKIGTFIPLTANNTDEAIKLILTERKKELCFRPGTRWADLRRLNHDPKYAITIKRVINGASYELKPGDNRYTFPIPVSVITKNNLIQNPR